MISDFELIEKYIYEWLISHDNILVPELGYFESHYKGSVIHPGIHHFVPPNKDIYFQPSAGYNDGVLEAFVAEKENISIENAQEKIQKYVTAVKIELGIQKKYAIDKIGILTLNIQGVVEFKPDDGSNFLEESYGLPNLFYKPVEKTETEQEPDYEPVFEKNTTTNDTNNDNDYLEEIRRNPAFSRYVIGAVLLVALVGGSWYAYQNNLFASFSNSTEQKVENKKQENKESKEENKSTQENQKEENKATKNQKEEAELPEIPTNISQSDLQNFAHNPKAPANATQVLVKKPVMRYFVVVASFDDTANAYSFYNNINSKGFKTVKIVNKDNKFRICSADFATKNDADEYSNALKKQNNISSWVLKY
ncbi:MAG: hypothetical protein EAZ55_14470 [Cytophagales bacterium]|nr:MAG: hypothetical protein EAZ55_14470 [Cytophagales bacterium]